MSFPTDVTTPRYDIVQNRLVEVLPDTARGWRYIGQLQLSTIPRQRLRRPPPIFIRPWLLRRLVWLTCLLLLHAEPRRQFCWSLPSTVGTKLRRKRSQWHVIVRRNVACELRYGSEEVHLHAPVGDVKDRSFEHRRHLVKFGSRAEFDGIDELGVPCEADVLDVEGPESIRHPIGL